MTTLTAFDRMNLARAIEHLESAQVSLEAVRAPDGSYARRLGRVRDRLADLLRDAQQLGKP
ncbi:MAG: hypothetical protein ACRDL8_08230 [Solirubrobacteraceae bacterium]